IAPAQWVNPINNRDSIASAAYVTEAPPAIETIERRQQRKSLCSERHAISRTGQQGSGPMLSRLFTIVLLAVASLRVNAASLTGVIITNEATSSSAVDVVAIDQVHTTIRSALADTVGDAQNQTEETRREALKTYRELAEKEPETYLPDVAATLNDLGIFDSDQNRIEKARKEFEEAVRTAGMKLGRNMPRRSRCTVSWRRKSRKPIYHTYRLRLTILGFSIMHRIGGSRLGRKSQRR